MEAPFPSFLLFYGIFLNAMTKQMVVCDLSGIEFRVLGWCSNCTAINDCAKHNRDSYLDFAVRLYADKNYSYDELKRLYDAEDKDVDLLRQNCKPPVLGCGYALGGGELVVNSFGDTVRSGLWGYALTVCGVDMPQELAHKAVKIYRELNYEVTQFWADMENAFKWTLRTGEPITVGEVMWNRYDKAWVPNNENFTGLRFPELKRKVSDISFVCVCLRDDICIT